MRRLWTLLLLLLLQTSAPAQVVGGVEPPPDSVSAGCGYDTRVCSWATRVVANGGAAPSAGTKAALNTFVLGMDSAGIWSKMVSVNCLVPDSLTAMVTPLLVGPGSDPWVNSGFSSGAVTVNGLVGDGTHVLKTGLDVSTAFSSTSAGMTLYVYQGSVIAGCDAASNPDFLISDTLFDCWDPSTSRVFPTIGNAGFISGSRTGANQKDTYYGNSTVTTLVRSSTTTTASSSSNSGMGGDTIHLMGDNHNGGVSDLFISTGTCSFFAIHAGLTSSDAQNLFNLVQAMRTALGGGTMDPVTEWAQRVVVNGGAAPGSTTKTALTTFYNGLYSDGLIGLVGMVNCIVPDSLVATETPLLTCTGNDPWVNHNFVSGDLTVNGIAGNASTKYMDTGFLPTQYPASSQLGTAHYVFTVSATGVEMSASTATQFFQVVSKFSDGHAYFFDNQAGVVIASPSGLGGFYAENRTSSTDHRAWFANSTHGFAQIGSTDTTTFGSYPGFNVFFLANDGAGTAQQWSSSRVSFGSINFGMNSTQLQNLYNRVQQVRTDLGGGNL